MTQNNNSITIGPVTIHQSANGLYLLTDLWKASGGNDADRPNKWLKLESTKKYTDYLDKKMTPINPVSNSESDGTIPSITFRQSFYETVKGNFSNDIPQGTYVNKNLVYSYAMWISPAFHDLVIATFDALVNANTVNELIAVKNQLDNVQQDLFHREPRDKQSLSVILQIATAKVKPYFDHLVSIGEVGRRWIPQHDKAEYFATENSKHIIGRKGSTVLFDDSVREAFPQNTSWL
jgi:hypothetical protein